MNKTGIHVHAETVRSVLGLLGRRSRKRISLMLQGLGISKEDADEVIAHGLAQGLFEVDPAEPDALRAKPSMAGP